MRLMPSNDQLHPLPIISVLAKVRAAISAARDGRYKALALTDLERLEIWVEPRRLGNASQRQAQVIERAGANVLAQLRAVLASYTNSSARTRVLDMLVELEHWAAKAEVVFVEPAAAPAKSAEVIETRGRDGDVRHDVVAAPPASKPAAAVQPAGKPTPAPTPAVMPPGAKTATAKPAAATPAPAPANAPKPAASVAFEGPGGESITELADIDPGTCTVAELRARLAALRPNGAFSADVEALEAMRGREVAAGNRSTALIEIDALLDQALADNSTRDDAATGVLPSGSLPTG
jgi:hypothetical protein